MKLSVIVATRNRAKAIPSCLDSIAAAFTRAAPLEAEIVIVDNGSTDDTAAVIAKWAGANAVPLQALSEPRPGKAKALNSALRVARGQLLVFTDDDCRLDSEYINNFLRHDGASSDLVLLGGGVELGEATDLPLTINTAKQGRRWRRAMNSVRHCQITGWINGCNMAIRRDLIDRLGLFDEDFGPGAHISTGEDSEYIFRAYTANTSIEYVPDMIVFHHHGRKTIDVGHNRMRDYMIGTGAVCMKYLFREPFLCRELYRDLKFAIKEMMRGTNTCCPFIRFSHKHKVRFAAKGAMKYLFMCVRTQRLDKLFGVSQEVPESGKTYHVVVSTKS